MDEPKLRSPRFRFSLHALFTITLLLAILCYALVTAVRESDPVKHGVPIDRSWQSGSLGIDLEIDATFARYLIQGEFPDANDGLYLKSDVWLCPVGGEPLFVRGTWGPLTRVIDDSQSGYDHSDDYYPELTGVPVQAILDYEIWEGEPRRGKLVCKDSVVSPEYVIPGVATPNNDATSLD